MRRQTNLCRESLLVQQPPLSSDAETGRVERRSLASDRNFKVAVAVSIVLAPNDAPDVVMILIAMMRS